MAVVGVVENGVRLCVYNYSVCVLSRTAKQCDGVSIFGYGVEFTLRTLASYPGPTQFFNVATLKNWVGPGYEPIVHHTRSDTSLYGKCEILIDCSGVLLILAMNMNSAPVP